MRYFCLLNQNQLCFGLIFSAVLSACHSFCYDDFIKCYCFNFNWCCILFIGIGVILGLSLPIRLQLSFLHAEMR